MEKRGQSNIIVTILVILISITAVLLLWNVFAPLIRERSKSIEESGEVLTVNLEIKEVLLFVTGASRVTVARGAGAGTFDSLKFVFYDENQNTYVETRANDIGEPETRTYSFSSQQNFGKIKSVSVFPVLGKTIGMKFDSGTNKIFEVPNGLVSWWKFDTDASDFIGNNNCGSAIIVTDSERQKVASFSGAGDFISCGNSADLNAQNRLAISFWVKTNSDGDLLKKGNNYLISLDQGRINFSYFAGALKSGASDSTANDGKWHNIAFSRDWGGDDYLRIYIDGSLDKLVFMPESPEANSESLSIGNSFNGFIDDLMFFNESLSALQVQNLYNNQK